MDWYLAPADPAALHELRHEIRGYLARHAAEGSRVDDAELVVEELVGNALRHAGGPVWVSLSWRRPRPTLHVHDLGPGFDPTRLQAAAQAPYGTAEPDETTLPEGGRGLFLVSHLAHNLEAATRAAGGAVVSAELPVLRGGTTSHDPPRRSSGALPDLAEARAAGGFDRETFLRALVVQLARTVELAHGPAAGEAAVAQVGTDVGGQMEEEYRRAEQVVGRMSPDQIAHCLVRLKHAIDGGFYVVEADEHRIILGNRRCPFGEAVQLAPSLCRMTSSVFGGISARNSDWGAAVLLEERIAVGDPGCRVVIWLEPPPEEASGLVHSYRRPG